MKIVWAGEDGARGPWVLRGVQFMTGRALNWVVCVLRAVLVRIAIAGAPRCGCEFFGDVYTGVVFGAQCCNCSDVVSGLES